MPLPHVPDALLLFYLVASVVLLILLILRTKLHPFIALTLASLLLGVAAQMPLDKIPASFATGVGALLSHVAIILGLGAVLGRVLADTGGALSISRALLSTFSERYLSWAMLLLGIVVGLPVFFDIGLFLLAPIAITVAQRSRRSPIVAGLPMLAGLSIVHALIPPHPAALIAVTAYHADIGRTILLGLLIAVPAGVLAGPVYARFIDWRFLRTSTQAENSLVDSEPPGAGLQQDPPSIFAAASVILLPILLICLGSFADLLMHNHGALYRIVHFLGAPEVSLLLAVLLSFLVLGRGRLTSAQILKSSEGALAGVASVLMILAAAGGYTRILQDSGASEATIRLALQAHMSPLVLAWVLAAVVRLSTGSATVAMAASAGIMAPVVAQSPHLHPELLALATGGGSIIFSHVNDGGFWLVKEYFHLDLKETFLSWSVCETILSVVILLFVLLFSLFLH